MNVPPIAVKIAPPIVSPKFSLSIPSSIMLLIPVHSIVIPVIVRTRPVVIATVLLKPLFSDISQFIPSMKDFDNFHNAKPAAISPMRIKILPNFVWKNSAHVSISSVSPAHSLNLLTSSSTFVVIASPRKSYSGSSIPKSPAPKPRPLPEPLEPSSGEIMFNSSMPVMAFFSFFAAFVASFVLSVRSPIASLPELIPE